MATLGNRAFDAIKQRVTGGEFRPGQVLSERELARELGMSKTPVRSAIARLENEGYVVVSPQRGIVVRGVGVEEVADCFELRMVLEPYVVREIAGRVTHEQAAEFRRRLASLREAVEAEDSARAAELDLALHLAFARVHGNHEIFRVLERMSERIRMSIGAVHRADPERLKLGHEEHEKMVRAVVRGDGERAAKVMRRHLERGKLALYPRNL